MSVIIRIVQPPGYPHWRALSDVADLLEYSTLDLGYSVMRDDIETEYVGPDTRIILGWHLLTAQDTYWATASRRIFYNLEQLAARDGWWTAERESILRQATEIWDYSPANIEFLRAHGFENVKLVPLGYHPALKRIEHRAESEKDIDVLFYGSCNPRRGRVLDAIQDLGMRVQALVHGTYGQDCDRYIARAKIVLNMHYYETQLMEQVRVSYLLNNGAFVVSEDAADNPYGMILVVGAAADLPMLCKEYAGRLSGDRGLNAAIASSDFSQRPMTEYLRAVL